MPINTDELYAAIELLSKDNLVSFDEVKEIIQKSVFKIVHDKYDPDAELELVSSEEDKEFRLINHSKLIVNDEEFEQRNGIFEIPLSKAKQIKDDAVVYTTISDEINFKEHPEITQNVRQLITQSLKERRKEAIYEKHKELKGEMIKVTVLSVTKTYVIVALEDGTTAFMPEKLRNKKIPLSNGKVTDVFVEDVLQESKDSQIVVSNGSPTLVKRVLEREVPEIADGTVEIVAISRTAGLRTKIAVKSTDENVDPVGAIIGAGGSRIKAIIEGLDGEKVDVILWSENHNEFIANALSPAKVIGIVDKSTETSNQKIVVTPNRHQTLAIGKFGSNAKLAVELTGARLDIISIADAKEKGIEFEWNGNVDPNQVEMIEDGQVIGRPPRRPNSNQGSHQQQHAGGFDNIMEEVDSFTEEMNTTEFVPVEPTKVEEVETFKETDEFDFDDLDLEKMQDNFSFESDFDFDVEADVPSVEGEEDFGDAEDYDYSDMAEFEESE